MNVLPLKKIQQHWQLSLLFIVFLPLLLHLGFWQLDRAQEKQQLFAVYQQQKKLPVKLFDPTEKNDSTHYQTLRVSGYYDSQRYWLLDNQSRAGQVGYEVIMPFKIESRIDSPESDQRWLLVNRGWVAASAFRDQLPTIETPSQRVDIHGYLYQTSANAVLSQTQSDLLIPWPQRVLQIETAVAENALDVALYPAQLRINDDSPGAFITHWSIINTQPEKHQAYAVQWFAMAFALCVLYFWMLRKA